MTKRAIGDPLCCSEAVNHLQYLYPVSPSLTFRSLLTVGPFAGIVVARSRCNNGTQASNRCVVFVPNLEPKTNQGGAIPCHCPTWSSQSLRYPALKACYCLALFRLFVVFYFIHLLCVCVCVCVCVCISL